MPVFIVQGKLGAGKGKYCVDKMREALFAGRRVATNMDIYLEHMCQPNSMRSLMRVPDKPTAEDLDALGHGNPDSYDEERNGLLCLDEAGTWLNARSFMDPARAAFIDWMLHARKKGWDVLLQVQDLGMVDKQFRTALAEVLIKCIRADKVRMPVVGHLLGKKGRLPRFHVASHTLADMPGFVIDREFYRGDDLHKCYDTRQVFRSDYPHGVHSLLPAWHLVGRHQRHQRRGWWARVFGGAPLRPPLKPKSALAKRLEQLPAERRLYWGARLAREGLL